jgi:hypothetical protein
MNGHAHIGIEPLAPFGRQTPFRDPVAWLNPAAAARSVPEERRDMPGVAEEALIQEYMEINGCTEPQARAVLMYLPILLG